jgi:hypothetical protein
MGSGTSNRYGRAKLKLEDGASERAVMNRLPVLVRPTVYPLRTEQLAEALFRHILALTG